MKHSEEEGDDMKEAGQIIFVIGLCAAVGGWGGVLTLKHGGLAIAGTAGFVMIVVGAIMMS